ncbi:hypothetical protein CRUP_014005, partial [Coryphaenoides rupestris]
VQTRELQVQTRELQVQTRELQMTCGSLVEGGVFTQSYCNICNAQLISESQRTAHYESRKHANKVRLFYMLHPQDGGPPCKKLRPDNPDSAETEVDRNKCCTLCNMFFTSAIVAQSHYQGKTHTKRVRLVLGDTPHLLTATPTTNTGLPATRTVLRCELSGATMTCGSLVEGGVFTQSYCNICNAQLISESQRTAHYESRKHANKVRLFYMLHPQDGGPPCKKLRPDNPDSAETEVDRNKCCTLCNMFFTSAIVAQSHYQGKTHTKRVRLVLGDTPHLLTATPTTNTGTHLVLGDTPHLLTATPTTNTGTHLGDTPHLLTATPSPTGTHLGDTPHLLTATPTTNTGVFTQSYCNICNAQLISESQRTAHYESRKHANKVRLFYMLHPQDGGPPCKKLRPDNPDSAETEVDRNKCCTLCNMFFTSAIVAQSHYQGKTHTKRVRLPLMAQQHYEGRKHRRNAARSRLLQQLAGRLEDQTPGLHSSYSCSVCRVVLNSIEQYHAHLQGVKHQNK